MTNRELFRLLRKSWFRRLINRLRHRQLTLQYRLEVFLLMQDRLQRRLGGLPVEKLDVALRRLENR